MLLTIFGTEGNARSTVMRGAGEKVEEQPSSIIRRNHLRNGSGSQSDLFDRARTIYARGRSRSHVKASAIL